MADTNALSSRIDAVFNDMETRRKQFQKEETHRHQEWTQRLELLGQTFDRLRDGWRPRLELLMQKFGERVKVKPVLTPSTRSANLEFESDVARIRLRLQATTDHDIRKVILKYDLEIIPVLMQFESHAEFETPLDAVDAEGMGRWLDERILTFVKTYATLHENQYYLRDQMVNDPVSGTKFPKFSAGATLERDGHKYYFISEETKREFEQKIAGKSK